MSVIFKSFIHFFSQQARFGPLLVYVFCLFSGTIIHGKEITTITQLKSSISSSKGKQKLRLMCVLGLWYHKSKKRKKAELIFRQVLKTDPTSELANLGMARVAISKKNLNKAQSLLTPLVQKKTASAMVFVTLSKVYRLRAQSSPQDQVNRKFLAKAIDYQQKAVKRKPGLPTYRYQLALLHLANNQYMKAHYHFLVLRAKHGKHSCNHLGLAIAETFLSNNHSKSLNTIQKYQVLCHNAQLKALAEQIVDSLALKLAQNHIQQNEMTEALILLRKFAKRSQRWNKFKQLYVILLLKKYGCDKVKKYFQQYFGKSLRKLPKKLKVTFRRCLK